MTVAYAIVIPFGWWERNVLAFGLNWLSAAVLVLAILAAERARRPGLADAALAVPVVAAIFIGMANIIPPGLWPYWGPRYLYVAAAWAIALPLRRALSGE